MAITWLHTTIIVAAESPDLKPVDYSVWKVLQERVYLTKNLQPGWIEAATARGVVMIKSEDSKWCNQQPVALQITGLHRNTQQTFPTEILMIMRMLSFNKVTNCLYFLSAVVLANVGYEDSQFFNVMLKIIR